MKQLERKEDTGALPCVPTHFDGNYLSRKEWKDHVAVRYGRQPKGLPACCDGCGAGLTVEHGLNCKCGGLIGIRHGDECQEWVHLNKVAHSNARVRTEPQIFYGSDVRAGQGTILDSGNGPQVEGGNKEGRDGDLGGESRGEVSVQGFWKRGRTTILDFVVTDTDKRSYGNTSSEKVLAQHEKRKKDKYLEACQERRRDFTPMVYSVDGVPGKEARAAEKQLASALASKWGRLYSEMVAFVRMRMTLVCARSVTLCLRGQRANGLCRAPDMGEAAAAAGYIKGD
ncbi:hypothetical protein ACHAWF_001761 [Thalassiosira exigua]